MIIYNYNYYKFISEYSILISITYLFKKLFPCRIAFAVIFLCSIYLVKNSNYIVKNIQ